MREREVERGEWERAAAKGKGRVVRARLAYLWVQHRKQSGAEGFGPEPSGRPAGDRPGLLGRL